MYSHYLKLVLIFLLCCCNKEIKCRGAVKRDSARKLRHLRRELLLHEFDERHYHAPIRKNNKYFHCNYHVKNWPNLNEDVPRYTISCPEENDQCVTITGKNGGKESLWEGCKSTSEVLFIYSNTNCSEKNCVEVNDVNENRRGSACCCRSKLCNNDQLRSKANSLTVKSLIYFISIVFIFIFM
uniref:Activin_recp domain-containing protein n=1 Tax=Strongyloides venezuelensis TaxID=75913 RepID=A0A0K0EZ24_STRVS